MFVTNEVVVAIKKGRHIQDNQGHGDSSLEYLRRLPSARQIDAFYGSKEPRKVDYFTSDGENIFQLLPLTGRRYLTPESVNKSNYEYPQGTILRADGGPVSTTPNCTWQRAVAGIAFGGLVPQASTHLVEAVTFTVGGSGQNCLKELELLINTLHTVDTESEVFGPYVAHRSVNGGLGSENIDFSPYPRRNPRDGAAIFGRYMNLVERIVARCEATSPGNPVEAVFEALCRLIDSTYHTAVEINQANSSREQALQDLGKIVQDVRLGLDNNSPISVQNCAQILRIILAAWAEQVACVEMKLDPEECRNRSHRGAEALVGYFANRVATLEDLPAVSALG